MTIGAASLFAGRIALGADNVTNPYGTGNINVITGGAGGSSVYVNRPGSVWNNRFFLAANGEGRGAIRAEQGGTFNGDIILTANASISSDGSATTTTLNGNISGAFTLTLGGQTGANAANKYVLTGNNVHSATTVGLGITNIDHDVALGSYNGTVTIHGNATLQAGAAGIILNPDHTIAMTGGASGPHHIDTQANHMTIQGVITGAATESLVKAGSGKLTLTGANTFSGATTIHAGTLEAGAPGALGSTASVAVNTGGTLLLSGAGDRINDSAAFTLSGGTFHTAGLSETVGALTLSASSIIDLGAGASVLRFADSSALTWTGTLSIWNWSGNPAIGGGTDQLFFGNGSGPGLTASQLMQVKFYSDAGATILPYAPGFSAFTGGFGEVVPVPEPSSVVVGLALCGLAGWRERRKSQARRRESRCAA